MFLSKLFSNARTRVMCALAGLTMVFGVGAAVNSFVSMQQNEAVETKAAVTEDYVRFRANVSWGDRETIWARSNGSVDFTQMSQSVAAHGNYPAGSSTGTEYLADLALTSSQTWLNFKFYTSQNNNWRENHPYVSGDTENNRSQYGIQLNGSWDNEYEPGCVYTLSVTGFKNDGWWDGQWHGWFNYSCVKTGVFIHYDYNGGTRATGAAQHIEQSVDSAYSTQAAPTKANHTFLGWQRNDTSTTVDAGASLGTLTSPLTLTAQWAEKTKYNVVQKYLVDGVEGATIGTSEVYDGGTWTPTAQPAKAGYIALGWVKSDKTTPISTNITVTGNTTVYSKYIKRNLYFRQKSNSYEADAAHILGETVTFGDSFAVYSDDITLDAGDMFKIADSDWSLGFGANDTDKNTKTFCNYLTTPTNVFAAGTDGNVSDNIRALVGGTYTITIKVFADNTFEITGLTRTPGAVSIRYYTLRDGIKTLQHTDTIWGGNSYSITQDTPANIFGYTLSCWYTEPIVSAEYLFSTRTVSSNLDLYAIYTACAYKTYFFEVKNADDSWNSGVEIHTYQTFGDVDVEQEAWESETAISPFYQDEDGTVYNAYLPVPTNDVPVTVILHVDGKGETEHISLSEATETSNCWQIDHWSGALYVGDWVTFEAGFKLTYSDGSLAKRMTKSNTGSDLAYATDVALSEGDRLKVVVSLTIAGSALKNKEYSTLGTDEITVHKTTDYATQGSGYWTMKGDDTYNFYINVAHNIYITDANEISKHGTIYLSNSKGWSTIYAYAYYINNSDVEVPTIGAWPGTPVSGIGSTEVTANLNFDGHGNLWKILLNNLSGTSNVSATHVIFSNGTKAMYSTDDIGTSCTGDIALGSSESFPDYYVNLTEGEATNITGSTSAATAARAAFNIEVAIRGASSSSACNISKSAAEALMADYNAATTAGQTLHTTATIETWNPASVNLSNLDPATSDTSFVSISTIVTKVISPISQGKTPAAFVIPGAPKQDQSPLTLTLWIVLGAGVLGLGAIGTAYFVSKKKKRNRA